MTPSITCPRCGRTSYNLHDIENRYCGACHLVHDELWLGEPDIVINGVRLSLPQAMTVRVAISHMQLALSDADFMREVGGIGQLYQQRLSELTQIMRRTAR